MTSCQDVVIALKPSESPVARDIAKTLAARIH